MSIPPWRATCVQIPSRVASAASDRDGAWTVVRANLARAEALIDGVFASAATADTRLLLFPEFAFQGPPLRESVAEWIEKACAPIPGPITEPLQAKARQHRTFIEANHFESTAEWPGRFFNTSFLIDASGAVILKYRRIYTAQWPSPHDLKDDYLARYGLDGTFPVADTELGRIAMFPCGEISVPEAARMFLLKGAEVLLHPDNAGSSPVIDAARITRAHENMSYLISCNVAGVTGFGGASGAQGGRSWIIDPDGAVLAAIEDASESTEVSAVIDIEALREARRELTMRNRLLRLRLDMYREVYASTTIYPPNGFAAQPMPDARATEPLVHAALANLTRLGISTELGDAPSRGKTAATARTGSQT